MRQGMKQKWVILTVLLFLCAALPVAGELLLANKTAVESSVICTENYVAITFDDGPQYKTTMALLDGLKERNVVATFFLLGEKIEERREVVLRMHEDGHLIGNHTYSHIQLTNISVDEAVREIDKTNALIAEITGETPTFIRPPFGSWSTQIEEKISMTPVLWTVDPCDWNTKNVNQIVNSVVKNTKNGDIILMHDIYETSVTAALEIVDRLKAQGYQFVTVDQLILD
jgi:peptidoglycan/xylan/chitin deacetylase (PgdA/CDA1 family)